MTIPTHAPVTFPYQIFRLGHALTSRFPCNIQSSQYMFNTQRIFHFRPRTSCRQYNYVGTHVVQIQQNSSTSASTILPLYFKILPQHLLPLLWGQIKVASLHKLYIRGVMPLHCQMLPYLFDETTGVQGHLNVSPQRELLPYGPHWEHCGCPLILRFWSWEEGFLLSNWNWNTFVNVLTEWFSHDQMFYFSHHQCKIRNRLWSHSCDNWSQTFPIFATFPLAYIILNVKKKRNRRDLGMRLNYCKWLKDWEEAWEWG